MAPSVLAKKLELENFTLDIREEKVKDFVEKFQCSVCQPKRRGRERNPLFDGIPRSVPCSKCGKDCTLASQKVYDLTGGDKDKIADYCKNYVCRSCNPDWGSWLKGKKRGKKAKAENVGFPKTATCTVCGKSVAIVPAQIRGKAEKMGISVEKLLKEYKCRSCGGVVRSKKGDNDE
jgi:hypothetical protein